MMKLIFDKREGKTWRVAKRFFAALVAFTLTCCNVAPISVWAAEETYERKAFFSLSENILDDFYDQVREAYGENDYLIQNFVFAGTSSIIYDMTDDAASVETDIHDFPLNPSQREAIITINTYFSGGDTDVEMRITLDRDEPDLAFVTDGGMVSLDELKSAVIRNGDEVTYVISLGLEELGLISYFIDESSQNYTLKFTDTDVYIRCISFRSGSNCYAVARGLSGDIDYTDSMTQVCDIQKAGSAWAAEITADDGGAQMLLTDTQDISFNWENDEYELSMADGIDEEALESLLSSVRDAYDTAEDDKEVVIDITDGASMLYLDSYVFIDPEEIKTYGQKASDLYYDAQINIYGMPLYITGTPDTLGSAQDYLGDVFDSGMLEGTIGIKIAKLHDDMTAGKLVLELPEDAQIRFTKGDGTGYEFGVDEVVNGAAASSDTTDSADVADTAAVAAETASAGETSVEETSAQDKTAEEIPGTASAQEISTDVSIPAETPEVRHDIENVVETGEEKLSGAAADTADQTQTEAEDEAQPASETPEAITEDAAEADKSSELIDGIRITTELDEDGEYADVVEASEPSDVIAESEEETEDTEDEALIPVGIVLSYKFLRMASYCAVADDMTICALYDENGKLSALADGYTEDDVAAYILIPAADSDVRLERIDFIYSDVVSLEVGQEYAEVLLDEDDAVDTVVREFIDAETKYSENLDINGIAGVKSVSAETQDEGSVNTAGTGSSASTVVIITDEAGDTGASDAAVTDESAASEESSSAQDGQSDEVVFSGGPGETADSQTSADMETQPEPIPDADVPAGSAADPGSDTGSYGDHYPGEDNGGGNNDDGDTEGDGSGEDSDNGGAAADAASQTADGPGAVDAGSESTDGFEDVDLSAVN